jgi:hypothetical protein
MDSPVDVEQMATPNVERASLSLGESLTEWTPSSLDLVRAVMGRSPSPFSELHGEGHWLAVAHAGLVVARETPGANLRSSPKGFSKCPRSSNSS